MSKKYTLRLALIVSIGLLLPLMSFAKGTISGYAYGKEWILPPFTSTNLESFPENGQLDRLDHLIASDIGCLANGSLFTGKLPNSWQGTPPSLNIWNGSKNKWLTSVINRAHAKGVKVSICVGGDTKYFPQATNSANLSNFVNNIVNFVNVHGFDGVNINWEYPRNATEWNQCIALLNSLKNNLPSGKTITIALSHSRHVYSNYPHVPQQILSIVDGIYLMTYDEGHSSWLSHSDVARSIQAINEWISWQTPTCAQKKKLFLGSAFYGWHPVVGGSGERISYRDFILNNNSDWNTNPGDVPADASSKAIHLRDNGFGGVFIWELGYDVPTNQSNSLLKAIHDVMPNVSGPTLVCDTTTTPFTLSNLPSGSTISWSKSNNLTYLNGHNTYQYRVRAASSTTSGPGWVQATLNGPCGSVQLPKQNVWVGLPGNFTTSPASTIYQPYNTLFGVILHPVSPTDHATYLWNTYGGVSLAGNNTGENISFFSSSFDDCGFIDITAQNSCGVRQGLYNSTIAVITGFGGDCGGIELPMGQEISEWSVKISPNPAQDYIDIEIMFDEKPVPFDPSNNFHISIYNANILSNPIETIKSTSPAIRIHVKHLNTGNYALLVIVNNELRITGKFIIKK